MPEQLSKEITVTVDLEDIEAVLEFSDINLEALDEEEFNNIRKSVSAVYKAVNEGRRAAWDEHSAKEQRHEIQPLS